MCIRDRVIDRIQQTGHTGMSECRVTDNRNGRKYSRIGSTFGPVSYTHLEAEPGLVYSFKVTAVNKGGESFPSEILSAYQAKKSNGHPRIL